MSAASQPLPNVKIKKEKKASGMYTKISELATQTLSPAHLIMFVLRTTVFRSTV